MGTAIKCPESAWMSKLQMTA